MSQYSYLRHEQLGDQDVQKLQARKANLPGNVDSTFVFLQVFAAADYFTLNQTLMEVVPPVAVDIILDPYVFNVFPRSLVPTAGYLIAIAITAWFVSSWVLRLFANPSKDTTTKTTARKAQ